MNSRKAIQWKGRCGLFLIPLSAFAEAGSNPASLALIPYSSPEICIAEAVREAFTDGASPKEVTLRSYGKLGDYLLDRDQILSVNADGLLFKDGRSIRYDSFSENLGSIQILHSGNVEFAALGPQGLDGVFGMKNGEVYSGHLLLKSPPKLLWKNPALEIKGAHFSQDRKKAAFLVKEDGMFQDLQYWDLEKGRKISTTYEIDYTFGRAASINYFGADVSRGDFAVALGTKTRSSETKLYRIHLPTGKSDWLPTGELPRSGNRVKMSPDGDHALLAYGDPKKNRPEGGKLMYWDLKEGRSFSLPDAHEYGVRKIEFSPDGKRVITGSDDGIAILWDLETRQKIHTLKIDGVKGRSVEHISVSPDGKRAIIGLDNASVAYWDLETGTLLDTLREKYVGPKNGEIVWIGPASLLGGSFQPDGRSFTGLLMDGKLVEWHLKSPSKRIEGTRIIQVK